MCQFHRTAFNLITSYAFPNPKFAKNVENLAKFENLSTIDRDQLRQILLGKSAFSFCLLKSYVKNFHEFFAQDFWFSLAQVRKRNSSFGDPGALAEIKNHILINWNSKKLNFSLKLLIYAHLSNFITLWFTPKCYHSSAIMKRRESGRCFELNSLA